MQTALSARPSFGVLSSALALLVSGGLASAQNSNQFTLQIGGAPLPPVTLVAHGDLWRYRIGSNAPPVGWQTNADATLDASWGTGPGGFGFEDGDDATLLTVMSNLYTTVYIRRTFEITETPDASRRLELLVDYDDGYVVWLDGVMVSRSPNITNAPGVEPAYYATTAPGQNHEALGYRGQPVPVIDLGPASTLAPGTHVLAVMGVNAGTSSSDLSLIVDLRLSAGQGTVGGGAFFSLVQTNVVTLSGTNTAPGSTRVVVNGDDAAFNPAQSTWTKTQTLNPGMNRLFIAALDANGAILAHTNRDLIAELATVSAGGTLAANTVWTSAAGVVRVTNTLSVPSGVKLTINDGVVVLLASDAGIVADGGGVNVVGTDANPVFFLPADGTTPWQALSAVGSNAALTVRRAEVVAGQVIASTNAVVTLEDSVVRDFRVSLRNLLEGSAGQQFTLRRCHVLRYDQCRFANTPTLIEDCLFEEVFDDGTDFADQPDVVIRRTTYRFGYGSNTDAIDNGGCPDMLVESCLIHDFPDKGVSIADRSDGTTVRNSLFHSLGTGLSAYNSTNCLFVNNTVGRSREGISMSEASPGVGPGQATATNLILWGNTNAVVLAGAASVGITFSDVGSTNVFPGVGNINADPQFVDPAAGDFRLGPGSPCLGAGLGGADMGVAFPVGGIPSAPALLTGAGVSTNTISLWWQDTADNEEGVAVERSTNGMIWQPVGGAPARATNFTDGALPMDTAFYYRVRATNSSGASRWSNLASARTLSLPRLIVSGTLASNTVWSPANGTVVMVGTVTVPTNVTLTVLAGTEIQVTNGASIRAVRGGTIRIEGTFENRVRLRPTGTNLWGELSAQFAGSSLSIRFADVAGGQTTVYSNAVLLAEDSYFHDYRVTSGGTTFNQPILVGHFAAPSAVRRCHFSNYYETLFRNGVYVVEDCLFENMVGDAMDFDGAHPGSEVRRCTYQHGNQGNVDAVDVGNDGANLSRGIVIRDSYMFDFPFDKGVSIGEESAGILVSNCLMRQVSRGVQVKDVSTATIANCTVVNAEIGIHCYEKIAGTGAGRATNTFNNILWHVTNAIAYDPATSVIVVNYSDLQGTNWPTGVGNLSSDPRFMDAGAGDYRLAPDSPCRGTGRDGADMGVRLPVGVFIPAPSDLVATGGSNVVALTWQDNSLSEAVFEIERSVDGSVFEHLAYAPRDATIFVDDTVTAGHRYGYRVLGLNIVTQSVSSAEAIAPVGLPPEITEQPASRVVAPGTAVSFSVVATGLEPLSFAWQHDGAPLSAETNSVLNLPAVQLDDAGGYRVVVTDAIGLSATSAVARLTVAVPPQLMLGAGGSGLDSNGLFTAQFGAPPNIHHVIEATTNFTDWVPLLTNSTGNGAIEFTDPASTNFLWRFYRARLLP